MFYLYAIFVRDSEKCYVGLTDNPANRFVSHCRMLTRNKHHCPELQMAFNSVGFVGMYFNILEEISTYAIAAEREVEYIKSNSCFNMDKTDIAKNISGANTRRIRCVENGEVFDSINQAGFLTGFNTNAIIDICAGRRKNISGFSFEYLNELPNISKNYNKGNWKKVIRSDGLVFDSMTEAAKSVKGNPESIGDVCKEKARTHKGFGWKYYAPAAD